MYATRYQRSIARLQSSLQVMKITLVSFYIRSVQLRCNCCLQYRYNEQKQALRKMPKV